MDDSLTALRRLLARSHALRAAHAAAPLPGRAKRGVVEADCVAGATAAAPAESSHSARARDHHWQGTRQGSGTTLCHRTGDGRRLAPLSGESSHPRSSAHAGRSGRQVAAQASRSRGGNPRHIAAGHAHCRREYGGGLARKTRGRERPGPGGAGRGCGQTETGGDNGRGRFLGQGCPGFCQSRHGSRHRK